MRGLREFVSTCYGLEVMKIHKDLPPGSILVFVTGRQEVHRLCRMLQQVERAGEVEDFEVEEEALEASDDEGNVSEPEEKVKKRKGQKRRKAVAKAAKGGEAEVTSQRSEEMPELSFAVGDEDVVVLEDERGAEDAKDIELRNQRKVRMSRRNRNEKSRRDSRRDGRLDKSRTAGGVFKGIGFAEGWLLLKTLIN